MRVRFLQNLGTDDARYCKTKFGVEVDAKACAVGAEVDLPDDAAEYLGRKYPALFEPAAKVRGEAKKPELTGPAK